MEFYDLNSWQESHKLVLTTYRLIKNFPKEERFGIIDQLRRASSSISANIAEGYGRYHFKDKIHFYYQARGSLKEVQNFMILARDLGYIVQEVLDDYMKQSLICEKLINGLIRSAENQI